GRAATRAGTGAFAVAWNAPAGFSSAATSADSANNRATKSGMGLLADLLSKVFGQQTANAGLGGISPPREGVPRKEQRAVANASALLPYRSQVRLTNLE